MKKNNILNTFICIVLISFISCGDMDETYRQFIEDGEIIYVGKADSVSTRGGKERIEVSWLLLSDPKVSKYKIFWNNRADSVTGSVTKTEMVDTVRVLLNNMPENLHNFIIYLYDDRGHSSIPSYVSGSSYGDFYSSTILNRTYSSITRIGTSDIQIKWNTAPGGLVKSEVSYVDTAGETITEVIPNDVEASILNNFPVGGTFEYKSAYLPEPEALDIFYTPVRAVTIDN
jgi:hypothetical protein